MLPPNDFDGGLVTYVICALSPSAKNDSCRRDAASSRPSPFRSTDQGIMCRAGWRKRAAAAMCRP